jgi:hypothetical protein
MKLEINELWMKVSPHNPYSHGGKALSQTGYVRGCLRCRLLQMPDNSLLMALRKMRFQFS